MTELPLWKELIDQAMQSISTRPALSPAAQAVLDAAFAVEDEWDTIPMIAAALRAAALIPNIDRLRLLAIADELEGHG
jgi:hypothetical protein